MVTAFIGMKREIGPNLAVVYGALQVGTKLAVYRMFHSVSSKGGQTPLVLQQLGALYELKKLEEYTTVLEMYNKIYTDANECLYPLLKSLKQEFGNQIKQALLIAQIQKLQMMMRSTSDANEDSSGLNTEAYGLK